MKQKKLTEWCGDRCTKHIQNKTCDVYMLQWGLKCTFSQTLCQTANNRGSLLALIHIKNLLFASISNGTLGGCMLKVIVSPLGSVALTVKMTVPMLMLGLTPTLSGRLSNVGFLSFPLASPSTG